MADTMTKVWRCPHCGKTVLEIDGDLEYGDIMCDACYVFMEYAGHQDIAVEEKKDVAVTWRVYATAEIFISRLLENEGYYLDDVIGGYVIRDLSTDKIVTESDGHPMDLDNVIRWVDSHFPYIDE